MKFDKNCIFETKRCRIRQFQNKDIDQFMQYRNNEEWMKYQGFKGLTKKEYIEALITEFDIDKGSQLAVILKKNNVLIGDLYLKKNEDHINIGYTINPLYSKQGIMSEVVTNLILYLSSEYPNCKILAETDIENKVSQNFLLKNGFACVDIRDMEKIYEYKIIEND